MTARFLFIGGLMSLLLVACVPNSKVYWQVGVATPHIVVTNRPYYSYHRPSYFVVRPYYHHYYRPYVDRVIDEDQSACYWSKGDLYCHTSIYRDDAHYDDYYRYHDSDDGTPMRRIH